ncbi:biosynthetic-type acetolactate synthase large subunit [Fodinisporobacter ferrooxydans]|uniref:Acetolactate synthase n=2 Tax=Fodinisporobacter ferrooxydans TaxID=2901836 RepID=A0ABY4CUC8_9BACL|nr:biosynthetic-type acetolactate synthase large subunit [Alicyclobacillaceae bacterium MYW30-H2]
MIQCLIDEGADVIFGYPGGAVLPIYDALYGQPIRHILTRHEQGAIHAAQGYARSLGKPGVVLATSGPGATNLVTGIADAYMDSTPLVIFTGQVSAEMIGRDGFQEADIIGITMPITKHNYQVRDAKDIPRIIKEAFYIANSGRPGPVLIDIPKNVSNQMVTVEKQTEVKIRGYNPNTEPHPSQIQKVAQALSQAERPLLYIGGGLVASEAAGVLRQFAEKYQLPVTSTLMGLGVFDTGHPLFAGMLGMHGTFSANKSIQNCDLLIACGVRFDDRVTGKLERFSPHSKKIHIDIDPAEIGKNVMAHIPVVGDAKQVLEALLKIDFEVPDTKPWLNLIQTWKDEFPLRYKKEPGILKPQQVIEMLHEACDEDSYITTEVGQHQMWTALFYPFSKPRRFITSGGLGTMGFGFPAAMGVQVARPDSTVVCVAGDASFQMNIQELQTVVENRLPVKIAVINNRFLGMVRQWQELFYEGRYAESKISAPDFVKVAEAFGAMGLRASTPEEAEQAIKIAMEYNGPVVIDFVVEEEENVFPMVPPGKGNDEMVGGWEE